MKNKRKSLMGDILDYQLSSEDSPNNHQDIKTITDDLYSFIQPVSKKNFDRWYRKYNSGNIQN